MERYIAIFRKAPNSDFGVEFPDVPGCFSAGSDLIEARAMAAEALRLHLDGLAEDGEPAPARREASAIMAELLASGVGDDFAALEEVEAEPHEEKVVRVNVTFTERILAVIDQQAKAAHRTRSAHLAELALAAGGPTADLHTHVAHPFVTKQGHGETLRAARPEGLIKSRPTDKPSRRR